LRPVLPVATLVGMDPATPVLDPAPKRCRGCFYILENLPAAACPECGRPFDPADEATVTRKPPFVWWTYWLPPLLLAGVGGGVVWAALVLSVGYGWATTLVMPAAIGCVMGYGAKPWGWRLLIRIIFFAWLATMVALCFLGAAGLVGGLCATVVACLALIPAAVGAALGIALRQGLRRSSFGQRDYLSILILLLPAAVAAIEGRHDGLAVMSVSTVSVIDAPLGKAWDGIQFYEEVRRPVPWLLWLSPSLRPRYTVGRSERVGDLKVCVYQRGHLIKRITDVEPGRRLAFAVVEQDRIENDGVTLLDGSFALEPIDGGRRTRVTLTTRYVPKLMPRFAYAWAEAWTVHTLHDHVLAGMKDRAEGHPPG
jgi:hypothetical protein